MSHASPVLSVADLERTPPTGTPLAVLGHPISHSISPPMHNAALAVMAAADARFATWRYHRIDVPPEELPSALSRLHTLGFHGLNLTVPHKILACAHVAHIDPAARAIGAVNTLLRTADGWQGFNTDGYGLATGINENLGLALTGADVLLLGAGGAARGAAVECLTRGCRSLAIANRTRSTVDTLIHDLAPLVPATTTLRAVDPHALPADLPDGLLVINATSAGLKPADPSPIDLSRLPRPKAVYDMIYNPPQTPLLRDAARLGLPWANGLSMLVHQGARALALWSQRDVPVSAMQQAVQRVLGGV